MQEFFTNLLSSAATKRDAKAYISRLKSPSKVKLVTREKSLARPQVNLGGLFGSARAVEQSPVFSQYELEQKKFEEQETLHVALVKISDLDQIADNIIVGIAETLCQLARLSMLPCVVLECTDTPDGELRRRLKEQSERLAVAIDAMSDHGARVIEDIFTIPDSGRPEIALPKLLLVPLRRGLIPIIVPSAYSEHSQTLTSLTAGEAMLTLTEEFKPRHQIQLPEKGQMLLQQISLDRIIVIDATGGIMNPDSADKRHVFLNLEQEFESVSQDLIAADTDTSLRQFNNLETFRQILELLPHSASGLIATPEEAANISKLEPELGPSMVGTRRQKNTLIHNLLTDKPAYSSSLPKSRLARKSGTISPPSVTTFIKHGMPLSILPNPAIRPWTVDAPRIKLTDPDIDLERLVYLIDDSFNRQLDVESYLKRVNDRIAGVIIAGDYEGGAILTWEAPPGIGIESTDRLVPYLDKFAVLKKSQGAGGVADIVFNAMVRTCFPGGVCWRSRKDNPVNKWYFERSRGTKKIPDMNWTMFWTTPGVAEDANRFKDYEDVCRGVIPTWVDKKMAAD